MAITKLSANCLRKRRQRTINQNKSDFMVFLPLGVGKPERSFAKCVWWSPWTAVSSGNPTTAIDVAQRIDQVVHYNFCSSLTTGLSLASLLVLIVTQPVTGSSFKICHHQFGALWIWCFASCESQLALRAVSASLVQQFWFESAEIASNVEHNTKCHFSFSSTDWYSLSSLLFTDYQTLDI